ncbi:leucine-rich-repeats and calponin homology domain protein isoform X2 [Bombus vancouverensis nearcticus]|uniref:Leucine-rich repeat and calponin homology domain-containing protein isoform X2 n=2 Tax=Pyrobombus TaxID=144703 RepID=A0A6P8M722_9HYME|nr:leucine-rich repeat and calponin homology domain-containing protein isoform X2 [Bombus impatiens]XP_033188538.1 leucine-rich repeat and calponin homology domain-containing protein isoform X2 [Bombus vancouverensis nearcticus]XP_033298420.1 leucine-rich repeat and calponin homology domain-containing protein isoform X2 [Bombus bifarius]XP_050482185.1 leucine-rich repeat and calponin homology domain-containing protein isoform X2 [Bombus huntii]
MAMVASNMSGHIQKQLTRSLERILEEAHLSGELKLSGRKLKDFPKVGKTGSSKYNLQDTVIADLSKNRFAELPEEVTEFLFLEKLHLYHNAIRIIPETVVMLQSLNYLDLSRNQLTSLPREICRLPLQTLLVAHNRLASLPDELGRMSALAELDAGCNEITNLPPRMGDLARLRSLDLRSNMIVHLPIELTYLRLVKLDISGNRISVLPNEMRKMKSLVDFRLSDNPLTSPPASLCIRGRTHIFKYLERQAAKHERARGGRARRTPLDVRGHATLDTRTHRRHNVDSGYSTSDGVDKRWSQEIHSAVHDGEIRGLWRQECSPLSITLPHETGVNGSCSGTSTPSTISPGEHTSLEDELGKAMILHDQLEKRKLERSTSENGADVRRPMTSGLYHASITPPGPLESAHLNQAVPVSTNTQSVQPLQTSISNATTSLMNGDEKRPLNHIQTYREYKEALRQQRANEGPSVYRPREQVTPPDNESQSNETDLASSKDALGMVGKQIFNEENATKRPVQKVTPSRINYQNTPIINGSNNEYNNKNGKYLEQPYKKPNSPIKTSSSILSSNTSPGHTPRLVKTAVGYVEGNKSPSRNGGSPKSPRSVTWNSNVPEKYSFTMRREFERAKEEADLIEQLRNHIETRLKMALPEDLAPALTDGVVLCHLANHVRPRSVASIHVPSPAVPKLTMARCRRNVDNFLEACRKIGVDENLVCCASDVLEGGRGVVRVAVTVSELLRFHQSRSPLQTTSSSNVPNHVSA